MNNLRRCIAVSMIILFQIIPGVFAIDTSATASSGDSTVSFSTKQSAPDTATVKDSAILSFNNGAGLTRQIAVSGNKASGDLHEEHDTYKPYGATAGVSVDIIGYESYSYNYALDPDPSALKAAKSSNPAKASETLDVTNAASISVAAFATSPKGDTAVQGLDVASKANTASLSKYSNFAQADKNGAAATQSFQSLTGVDSGANIYGDAYSQDEDENIIASASTSISDQQSEEVGSGTTMVTNYKATSIMKSKTTPSATCSADLISGMYLDLYGLALAAGTVGSAKWDNQLYGYNADDGALYPATISKYSQTVSADTKSASEIVSFSSLSAASNDLCEGASNVINTYNGDNVVNSVGDESYHLLSGAGTVVEGVYTPLTINGYSSNFKVKTGIGSAGSVSIQSAVVPESLESYQESTHFFGADKGGKIWNDLSESQISISNGRLEPLNKGSPAYKMTTAASPKLTNVLQTEVRGKGDEFSIYSSAYSDALSQAKDDYAYIYDQDGADFSSAAATSSSGKLGDKKGASSSASVTLVKAY